MFELKFVSQLSDKKALLLRDELYKNVSGLEHEGELDLIPDRYSLLAVHDKGNLVGVVYLQPWSNTEIVMHGGIYKEFRGGNSTKYLNKCLKTLKRILYPYHIVTMVKEDNIVAVKMVDRSKFKFKRVIKIHDNNYRFYVE